MTDQTHREKQLLGLVLNLSKMPTKGNGQEKNADYTIFGYYDRMSIQAVESWPELTPAGMLKNNRDTSNIENTALDSFPVKLLFPSAKILEAGKNKGFDYSYWNGWKNAKKTNQKDLLSIVLLNMTDKYFQKNNTLDSGVEYLLEKIPELLGMDSTSFESLHCGVFQCIGLYDYVLLMESDGWTPVFQLLENLRTLTIKREDQEKKEIAIISNSYTIFGVRNDVEIQKIKQNESLNLCIRFALNNEISANKFIETFCSWAENKNVSLWETKDRKNVMQSASIYGQYDCQICLELPLQKALSIYLSGGFFSRPEFYTMVLDSSTLIRKRSESEVTKKGINPTEFVPLDLIETFSTDTESQIPGKSWERYNKLLKNCIKCWEGNRCHCRTLYALQQLFRLLHSLSYNTHDRDALTFLVDAFDSMCFNIEMQVLQIEPETTDIRYLIEGADEGLENFRQYVGGYMLDLAYSERIFIEGLKSSHVSIGSATKLLFAYNQMLRELVKAVARNDSEGTFRYSFVVVAGGCDATEVENLFDSEPLMLKNKLTEDRLLVIRLSEMSIYDVRGTMLRSIHEAWHYCGNRFRKERAQYACESLARLLSFALTQMCFPPHEWSDYEFELRESVPANIKKLEKTWYMTLYKEKRNDLEQRLAKAVFEYLSSSWLAASQKQNTEYSKNDERNYYSTAFWNACAEVLYNGMTELPKIPEYGEKHDILSVLYPIWWTVYCDYLKSLIRAGRKKGIYVQRFEMQYNELCQFPPESKETALPVRIKLFSGYIQSMAGVMVVDEEYLPWEKLKTPSMQEFRETYQLSLFIDTLRRAYNESLSDVMAIKTLKATFGEYLFSLFYEGWILDKVLPRDTSWALRLGVVVECCYGGFSHGLQDEDVESIRQVFDLFVQQASWAELRFDVDGLIERVEELLNDFYNGGVVSWIAEPLVEYLHICENQIINLEQQENETLKHLREVYNISRKSSVKESEPAMDGGLNSLLQYWIDLNKVEGDVKDGNAQKNDSSRRA